MSPVTTPILGDLVVASKTCAPAGKQGSKRHLDNLDVIRGLAILGVLLFHSVDSVWRYDNYFWNGNVAKITFDFNQGTSFWLYPSVLGWLGVAIFFALSGFCIHYSQGSDERPRMWLDFFLKRSFRILPAYWAVLLVLAAQRVNWHESQSVGGFFLHLCLLHNFSNHEIYGLNPAFWSIAVEAQLYLLYPIIWYGARKFGWGLIVFLTLVIETVIHSGGLVGLSWPSFLLESPFAFWFSWTIGAFAADLYKQGKNGFHASFLGWVGILAGFVAAYWKTTVSFSFPLVATGTALLLLGGWNWPAPLRRITAMLGIWSYSLYLIHQPFMQKIGDLGNGMKFPKLLTLLGVWTTAAITVLMAGILFRWLESPSIELGRRVKAKLTSREAL